MDCTEKLTVSEELAAKTMGRFIMKTLKIVYEREDPLEIPVKSKAEQALQEIKNAMENQELSDFDCIEKIIHIFDRYGIDTFRHDFG